MNSDATPNNDISVGLGRNAYGIRLIISVFSREKSISVPGTILGSPVLICNYPATGKNQDTTIQMVEKLGISECQYIAHLSDKYNMADCP